MDMRQRPTADWDIVVHERIAAGCLDRRGEETEHMIATPIGVDHTLARRCSAYDEHVGVRTFRQIRTRRRAHLAWFIGRIAPRSTHVSPLSIRSLRDATRGHAVRQCFDKPI
jgi:hypothetical protein